MAGGRIGRNPDPDVGEIFDGERQDSARWASQKPFCGLSIGTRTVEGAALQARYAELTPTLDGLVQVFNPNTPIHRPLKAAEPRDQSAVYIRFLCEDPAQQTGLSREPEKAAQDT